MWETQTDGYLPVSIPGYSNMVARVTGVFNPESVDTPKNEYTWMGRFADSVVTVDTNYYFHEGQFELFKKNGKVTGIINPKGLNTDFYEIAAFPSGKNVLIKFNPGIDQCPVAAVPGEPTSPTTTSPCNKVVKVLFLYTGAGASHVPDITGTCNTALNLLNGAIWNTTSNSSDVWFESAGIVDISSSFTESSNNMYLTRDRFRISTYVNYIRSIYGADLVIGLTDVNDNNYWGLSANLGRPNVDYSFAVLDADRANDKFTLVHEVGHLMGARHQQSSFTGGITGDDDNSDYPHGFAIHKNYLLIHYRYSDIMTVNINDIKKEHVFSYHDLEMHNRLFGNYNTNDAMRVLQESACTVADFRDPGTTPVFDAHITGPWKAATGNNITLTVTPLNGIATYTYDWWVSYNGGRSYANLGSTTNYGNGTKTVTMNNAPMLLFKVLVHNGYGGYTKWVYKTVINEYSLLTTQKANGPSARGENTGVSAIENTSSTLSLVPNPASQSVSVQLNDVKGELNISIYDIYGRVIAHKIVDGQDKTWQFDTSMLPAGNYIVEASRHNFKQTKKLVITR